MPKKRLGDGQIINGGQFQIARIPGDQGHGHAETFEQLDIVSALKAIPFCRSKSKQAVTAAETLRRLSQPQVLTRNGICYSVARAGTFDGGGTRHSNDGTRGSCQGLQAGADAGARYQRANGVMYQNAIAPIINGTQCGMNTVLATGTARDDRTGKRRLRGKCGDLVMPRRIHCQPGAIDESSEGLKGACQHRAAIK